MLYETGIVIVLLLSVFLSYICTRLIWENNFDPFSRQKERTKLIREINKGGKFRTEDIIDLLKRQTDLTRFPFEKKNISVILSEEKEVQSMRRRLNRKKSKMTLSKIKYGEPAGKSGFFGSCYECTIEGYRKVYVAKILEPRDNETKTSRTRTVLRECLIEYDPTNDTNSTRLQTLNTSKKLVRHNPGGNRQSVGFFPYHPSLSSILLYDSNSIIDFSKLTDSDHRKTSFLKTSGKEVAGLILMLHLESDSKPFLNARIKERSEISDLEICYMFRQLVDASKCLSDRGFIHRDIHPGNIFIQRDLGRLVLGDNSCSLFFPEVASRKNKDRFLVNVTNEILLSPCYQNYIDNDGIRKGVPPDLFPVLGEQELLRPSQAELIVGIGVPMDFYGYDLWAIAMFIYDVCVLRSGVFKLNNAYPKSIPDEDLNSQFNHVRYVPLQGRHKKLSQLIRKMLDVRPKLRLRDHGEIIKELDVITKELEETYQEKKSHVRNVKYCIFSTVFLIISFLSIFIFSRVMYKLLEPDSFSLEGIEYVDHFIIPDRIFIKNEKLRIEFDDLKKSYRASNHSDSLARLVTIRVDFFSFLESVQDGRSNIRKNYDCYYEVECWYKMNSDAAVLEFWSGENSGLTGGNLTVAKIYFKNGLVYAEITSNPLLESHFHSRLGYVEFDLGNMRESNLATTTAYILTERSLPEEYKMRSLERALKAQQVGRSYFDCFGDYDSSISWHDDALVYVRFDCSVVPEDSQEYCNAARPFREFQILQQKAEAHIGAGLQKEFLGKGLNRSFEWREGIKILEGMLELETGMDIRTAPGLSIDSELGKAYLLLAGLHGYFGEWVEYDGYIKKCENIW